MRCTALVAILMLTSTCVGQCPNKCRCTKHLAFCKTAELQSLPSELPTTTERLTMETDTIVQLNGSIVRNSGLRNLTRLFLIEVKLEEIHSETFKTMNLLESLSITGNNITEIKSNTFKFLTKLYFLNLAENNIRNLNPGSFSGLANLRYLDLSFNRIKYLQANIFHDMKNNSYCKVIKTAATLNLRGNYIYFTEFEVFQHLCLFSHLYLDIMSFENVTNGAFVGLTRVTELLLSETTDTKIGNFFNGLSSLKRLEITAGKIEDIETGAFGNLTLLKHLNLENNRICEIKSGMFEGLDSLEVLTLNANKISTLNKNVFIHLKSLQTLNMWLCQITRIEPDAFNCLSQLRKLNLYDNNINALMNNTFSNLNKLRELYLHKNQLKIIETGAFPKPWTVNVLSSNMSHRIDDISYNILLYQISSASVAFRIEARLNNLKFSTYVKSRDYQELKFTKFNINATSANLQQQLNDIKQIVHNKKELTLIITAMNSTETLAALSTFQFPNLHIQESNFLEFKANDFSNLSELKNLKIKNCEMLTVHRNAFQQMKSLTKITITFNGQTKIENGSFYGLHNLTYLDIQKNQMTELRTGTFLGLHNLKILDLSNNKLRSLRVGTFKGLHIIEQLYLKFNKLEEIKAGVFGAVCENGFKLSCKNVSNVSPHCNATNALRTLQYLDLSNNIIAYIHPHAFVLCTNLNTLQVFNNKFLTLDDRFLFTPALTYFCMDHCNISNVPNDTFECTPKLSHIRLSVHNTTLHVTPLLQLKHLQSIEVELNPFKLDCAICKTWLWLEEHNIDYNIKKNFSENFNDLRRQFIDALSKLNCGYILDGKDHNSTIATKDFQFFIQYIEPIVFFIILISGIASNGFLLFISLCHSDMRKKQNACLIHLIIVELLSLILNLPLSYWNALVISWELNKTMCKVFIFGKDVILGVNVYSIIVLSIERFLIARSFKKLKNVCNSNNQPTTWLLFMTWISSIVLSLPAYFSATVETRCLSCPPGNEEFIKQIMTFQFIIHYLLPAIVIGILNIMTSKFLKESVRRMPGEDKNSFRARNRKTAANVVLILALVFIISYLPNFILRVLVAWSVVNMEDVFLVSFFSFSLFFCNTIFNPISIFIMSSRHKMYILQYFPFLMNTSGTKFNSIPGEVNLQALYRRQNQNSKMLQYQLSSNNKRANNRQINLHVTIAKPPHI